MLVMFGMVAVQGIRMLMEVDFTNDKNLLITAVSIGFGLGFNIMPTLFSQLPQQFKCLRGMGSS